jgi:hypothetical protein
MVFVRNIIHICYCCRLVIYRLNNFLGALAKLRRVTVSFVMSVHMERLGSHWTDFREILWFWISRKSIEKIQVSLKSDKNKGYFTWRAKYIFFISHSFLPGMRNVSGEHCRENQNTHFVFSNFFFLIVPFMRKCRKILLSGQATDDNMAHVHCMLYI